MMYTNLTQGDLFPTQEERYRDICVDYLENAKEDDWFADIIIRYLNTPIKEKENEKVQIKTCSI